jgi:hypothetical protein
MLLEIISSFSSLRVTDVAVFNFFKEHMENHSKDSCFFHDEEEASLVVKH